MAGDTFSGDDEAHRAARAATERMASPESPKPAGHADTLDAGRSPSLSDARGRELAAGTMLDDVYRVVRKIGGGAMGVVYLVEHIRLGRRFAAKVVAAAHAADEEIMARLQNEARVASSIQHENIVDVTHLGMLPDGAVFVVMELLEGNDLRHRLVEQSNEGVPWLPDDEVRRVVHDVLTGLHAAHEVGVIHRDLKPDNVFLAKKGTRVRAKIVDFGISKVQTTKEDMRLTRTGQIMGTPLYMAPEQTRGTADVDRRADIYAMGVILYELVTGRLPFEATSIYDLVVKHATEVPPSPRAYRPDLPEPVALVIMRSLEKKPEARYQTAEALLEDWEAAWKTASRAPSVRPPAAAATAPDVPPPTTPPATAPSAVEPPPRPTTSPMLLGGGVVVALLVAVGLWQVLGSAPAAPPTTAPVVSMAVPPPSTPPVPSAVPSLVPPSVAATVPVGIEPPADVQRTIVSEPVADVYVDGALAGHTPYVLSIPADGAIDVQLRARGYRNADRTVHASDAEPVEVTLERAPRATHSDLPTLAPH